MTLRILKLIEPLQSCLKKGSFPLYWTYKRRIRFKTPCSLDGDGKPLPLTLTEGQVRTIKVHLFFWTHCLKPKNSWQIAVDATWFRNALLSRAITPCIPSKKNRNQSVFYDENLYRQRHKIEIMFGRLKG